MSLLGHFTPPSTAADAEAICEAVTRPTMRFVAVKSEEQQAALMLHKTRDLLVRQRTMLINALRAHLGEYGIVKAQGPAGVNSLLALVQEAQDAVPVHAQSALRSIVAQFHALGREIGHLEKAQSARSCDFGQVEERTLNA